MSNRDEEFAVWLRTKFDGDALAAARQSFDKTKSGADELGKGLDKAGWSAESLSKKLKQSLTDLVAFATVTQQLRQGFEDVQLIDRAFASLEAATKRTGESFPKVKKEALELAEYLRKTAAITDEEATPAIIKLYREYGNMANAQDAVKLALALTRSEAIPFEKALEVVHQAAIGNGRGLRELGIVIEDTGGRAQTAGVLLNALAERARGATIDHSKMTFQVKAAAAAWDEMREGIVRGLMEGFGPAVKVLQSVREVLSLLSTAFVDMGTVAVQAFTAPYKILYTLATEGPRQALTAAKTVIADMANTGAHIVASAKQTVVDIAKVWKEGAKKIALEVDSIPPPMKVRTGSEGAKQDTSDSNEFVLIGGVLYRRSDLLAATTEAYKKAREIADREEKFATLQQKRERKDKQEALKEEEREREASFHRMNQLILDQARLQRQAEKAKRDTLFETLDAGVGAAREAFGDSKEVALAEAIINTARAVTAASPNVWLMAFAAATGIAQIAKIQSTEVGSTGGDATKGRGFDNPQYDAASIAGGRRWALDMVGDFSKGARQGWAEGMSGRSSAVTHDNSRTYNFNNVQFADPFAVAGLKKLKRQLDVIDRTVDSQRIVARSR